MPPQDLSFRQPVGLPRPVLCTGRLLLQTLGRCLLYDNWPQKLNKAGSSIGIAPERARQLTNVFLRDHPDLRFLQTLCQNP
jgi:hypothetical protein